MFMVFGPPLRTCDRPAVNNKGNDRGNHFRDPERIPDANGSKSLLSKNAVGMMTTTYRQSEISKEGVPLHRHLLKPGLRQAPICKSLHCGAS